jgi:signal transduction histidine kinase
MLEDLGILACVSWICREFQNAYPGILIQKTIEIEETDIPEDIKMVIYRILQEALNNIAKHSEADRASLFLRKIENVIELMIQDNGRGFEAQEILSGAKITMGLGLGSMRERTEAADGVFAVESAKGKGTTIQVSWAL